MKEPHPNRGEGEGVWRGVRSMGEEKSWGRTEKKERKGAEWESHPECKRRGFPSKLNDKQNWTVWPHR